ncbi:MAG: carboxypeptidase regulatory-like domain-containing protein, partial [Gemmatimonadaceae bacterium]
QPTGTGRVRGVVVDAITRNPVRATLSVTPGRQSTITDSAGRFVLSDLAPGSVTLVSTAFGHRVERTDIRLQSDELIEVTIVMRPLSQTLTEMRTTATPGNESTQAAAPAGSATVSMSRRELASVPAVGEADVLRAVSLLPGISARNDFWAGFNIRGGESDQTQVRLDGLPVISPFHLGGLFSTFIADAVQNVDARVGALPASYGGRLSGVLDVTSAQETRTGIHGSMDVTAIATSARVGGAFPGLFVSTPGSWNAAVRRTYVDKLADVFLGRGKFPYHFQDAQLHIATPARGGGILAMTAYAGSDVLNPTAQGSGTVFTDSGTAFRFDWGNRLAGATFTQPLGSSAQWVQRVAYSRFATSYADVDDGARLFNAISEIRLSGDLTRRFGGASPTLALGTGYELSRLRTKYDEYISARAADETFGTTVAVDDTIIRQRARTISVFGEVLWTPNAKFSVRGGVRSDKVSHTQSTGVSPRLSAKLRVHPRLSFTGAVGRYAQWTHAVRNEDLPLRIVDIWFVSDPSVPVSTGVERVVGSEYWLNDHNLIRLDLYSKQFTDLVEPTSTVDPRLRPSNLRKFGGRSRGAELLLRHVSSDHWGGWIAYSFGRSIRERNGETYFAAHDRRHDLNVVGNYQWNDRYTFGARLGVASGTPYTGWAGTYGRWSYDPVARRWRAPGFSSDARNEQARTERNGQRYPAYERLDLSIHRAFRIRGAEADASLNIINALATQNVLVYSIDNEQSPPVLRGLSQLPFLPTLGLRVTF